MLGNKQELTEAALVIIRKAYQRQPELPTLAISQDGSAIGAWSKEQERFVMVAGHTITGQWVSMPYELLVNGQRIEHGWTPYARETVNGFPTVSGKTLTQGQAPMFEPLGG